MKKIKIGIIGCGNMGSALAKRIGKTLVYDKDLRRTEGFKEAAVAKDIGDLALRADTVVLAVKPQDIGGVLAEIKNIGRPKLVISIAAGITTGYIEKILGDIEVVRAMPNLAARIGMGMTELCGGSFTSEKNFRRAQRLFRSLGKVLAVGERMMNAATAVSGSGPAYVCYFMEKGMGENEFLTGFRRAAEKAGFNKKDAALLVNATFLGTKAFLKKTRAAPADLIKQVASKGGTTEAALGVLQNGGSLEEAVLAAKKRAEELCL